VKPLSQRLNEQSRRLGDQKSRMSRALIQAVSRKKDRLHAEAKLFGSLNYRSVLARGFAVVRDAQNKPLRGLSGIAHNAALEIEMADGRLAVSPTQKKSQGSLF
jgi:exodeoxyribonuclease VII large subunit